MPVTAIVGAQWGDEGKGKITDLLAQESDLVIRFGGGSNAGHTVVNQHGEFTLHLVPSGIFNPEATNLVGTGALADFYSLTDEVADLTGHGISVARLRLSSRSQVVMPYHRLLDRLEDEARGSMTLGTTRRGVGPAYVDRAARVGIQVADLLCPETLRAKLAHVLPHKNRLLQEVYGHAPLDFDQVLTEAAGWGERFGGMITDHVELVGDALDRRQRILLEGQLGTMRDLNWGTYPYVTSSTTVSGGGTVGGGIPPRHVDRVVGVVKAYTTAVGTGPVPTELEGILAEELRERGGEYGATTGRPRRIGWFDAVAVRYAHRLNGFTGVAITKLDVLDGLDTVKMATAYQVGENRYHTVPATNLLERVQPIYEELPGWHEPTMQARRWSDLPLNAQHYLRRIEELTGVDITVVSVGKAREQTIHR